MPVDPVIRINEGGAEWDPRFSVFVIAGQEITIQAEIPGGLAQRWEGDGEFVSDAAPASAKGAAFEPVQNTARLKWRAPSTPGSASIVLKTTDPVHGWVEASRLNVQVMAPARELANGKIDGYRIGSYPAPVAGKPVDYVPPSGFLKVSEAQSTPISPHFNLEDFACKQKHEGGDRYLALEPKLIPFLEAIAARVAEEGFVAREPDARPIIIMSGFRTPAYNKSLGNVQLSRHQYGDASDIIIDTDGNGSMDDLNRDGRVNGNDARLLASWIEDLWTRPEFVDRPGGLGIYNGNGTHGPFVHVDLRGQRSRWGGNGLEWNDEAVSQAAEQARVIQTASYSKPAPKKAVKSARSRGTDNTRR